MTSLRPLNFAGRVLLLLATIAAAGIPAAAAASVSATLPGLLERSVLADFDGDHKADFAELHRSSLDLRMGSGNQQRLPLRSGNDVSGMEIVVVDVDSDSDLDIVVQNRFLARRAEVWLNDGKGSFSEHSIWHHRFPIERKSWNQSLASEADPAIAVKPPIPLADLSAIGFLAPPSFGAEANGLSERCAARIHHDITRLRAPPAVFPA